MALTGQREDQEAQRPDAGLLLERLDGVRPEVAAHGAQHDERPGHEDEQDDRGADEPPCRVRAWTAALGSRRSALG